MEPDRVISIVVVGEAGVGKTSLITTMVSNSFHNKVPPTIPPVKVTRKKQGESIRTDLIDTSSKSSDQNSVDSEISKANFICIVYDVNDRRTLEAVDKWILRIHNIKGKVPLALVGTKTDIRDKNGPKRSWEELEQDMTPYMNKYDDIEYVLECSSNDKDSVGNIDELFWYAQQAVLYPRMPLCDAELNFTTEFTSVIKRLFQLNDSDKDGYLNNNDIISFQRLCFEEDLTEDTVEQIKKSISSHDSSNELGTTALGLTEYGFLSLFHLMLERGSSETIWAILRRYGYNDNLKLEEWYCCPSLEVGTGERVELSPSGENFLKKLYETYQKRSRRPFNRKLLKRLFIVTPETYSHPWNKFGFSECCHTRMIDHKTSRVGDEEEEDDDKTSIATSTSSVTSLDEMEPDDYEIIPYTSFLAMWQLTTLKDYKETTRYLAYLGYGTEKKLQKGQSPVEDSVLALCPKDRTVFLAYVFGDIGSGKHSLLELFVKKKESVKQQQSHSQDNQLDDNTLHANRFGDNEKVASERSRKNASKIAVDRIDKKYTLILEIPNDEPRQPNEIPSVIQNRNEMHNCDLALLVYDQSSLQSFEYVRLLHEKIKSVHPKLPLLLVASKSDMPVFQAIPPQLTPEQFISKHRFKHVSISVKEKQLNNLYSTIIETIKEYHRPRRSYQKILLDLLKAITKYTLIFGGLYVLCVTGFYYKNYSTLSGLNIDDFKEPILGLRDFVLNQYHSFIKDNKTVAVLNTTGSVESKGVQTGGPPKSIMRSGRSKISPEE